MLNPESYNKFIRSLDKNARENLFFHNIENQIYITDENHKLLGIWDLNKGQPTKK